MDFLIEAIQVRLPLSSTASATLKSLVVRSWSDQGEGPINRELYLANRSFRNGVVAVDCIASFSEQMKTVQCNSLWKGIGLWLDGVGGGFNCVATGGSFVGMR